MYESVGHLQEQAIKNAAQLRARYSQPNPAQDNPFTSVDLLVKRLNDVARKAGKIR